MGWTSSGPCQGDDDSLNGWRLRVSIIGGPDRPAGITLATDLSRIPSSDPTLISGMEGNNYL